MGLSWICIIPGKMFYLYCQNYLLLYSRWNNKIILDKTVKMPVSDKKMVQNSDASLKTSTVPQLNKPG